jgi:serine/threonine protein kinase
MKDYGIDPEKIIKLPTLGDYQIEKLLGENQFGRVIQCKHLESGVRRAIRVFDRKRPKQQPDDQLREEYNEKLWADANKEQNTHDKVNGINNVIKSFGIERDQDNDICIV